MPYIEINGSELFFVDNYSDPANPVMYSIECVTDGFNSSGDTVNFEDFQCLSQKMPEKSETNRTAGTTSLTIRLPANTPAHKALIVARNLAPTPDIQFMELNGDDASIPTLSGSTMTPPKSGNTITRTGVSYTAKIANFDRQSNLNGYLTYAITLARNEFITDNEFFKGDSISIAP